MTPLALLLPLLSAPLADEGMWMPEQLPELGPRLVEMGLELPPEQLADTRAAPLGAVVSLGGCSASFLSDQGLIGTNHHCVQGYLRYAADGDAEIVEQGLLAASLEEEPSAGPAARLWVVEEIEDVTEAVNKGVRPWTKDRRREERVARNRKELVAECEAGAADRRCQVVPVYGGQSWRRVVRKELRDLRLVWVPAQGVGDYGGEEDNWMWPRHAGDVALLRAYVAPDGAAAEYSPDNLPYSPPHHLQLASEGLSEGDFVMVAGYPGRTYRYRSARQLRFARDRRYPADIELRQALLEIYRAEAARSEEAAARLDAPIGWVSNGIKYRQGNLDAFHGSGVVEDKEAAWAELEAWVEATEERRDRYGPVLEELDALQAQAEEEWEQRRLIDSLLYTNDLLSAAHRAYRFAVEAEEPDAERDAGYQDRDRERAAQRMASMQRGLWLPADRAAMEELLERAQAPGAPKVKALESWLTAMGGAEAAVQALFDEPELAQTPARLALMDLSAEELRASEDPWVKLAVALEDGFWAPLREEARARRGATLRLEPLYMEALVASQPGPVYPDANSTLRVTVGHVRGYSPRDGVWHLPFTTVAGVVAKHTGEGDFMAPQALLEAAPDAPESRWADPSLGDVPVDFLTTLDTTGGNSGSATLNGRGELVGFIFDGNYEAMSADWVFDPELTRSIHVDLRYVLWLLEVQGGQRLLEELGVDGGSPEPAPID